MKLPRWLVILMLTASVLLPLAGGGWWWVTWPGRTAREFQMLLVERKWDDADTIMLDEGLEYPAETIIAWLAGSRPDELSLTPQPLTYGDLCLGRRHFKLGEIRVVYFMADKCRITEWNTWSSERHHLNH